MEKKFLIIRLNEQKFAIDLRFAREIIPYSLPTKIPNAPDFFEGVIHLRGFFLPLINTKRLLGIENKNDDSEKKRKVLILSVFKKIVGLMTSDVEDILKVDEKQILPSPGLVSNLKHNYFSGGFYIKEEVIMIIDIERLFTEHILPNKVLMKGADY